VRLHRLPELVLVLKGVPSSRAGALQLCHFNTLKRI
jgi:hypothetical protein